MTKHGIFTEAEFHARYEIHLETYRKVVRIEAQTAVDMVQRQILPAATAYTTFLCSSAAAKKEFGATCKAETELIHTLSQETDALYEVCQKLKADLKAVPADSRESAAYYRQVIVKDMAQLRSHADVLEQLTDKRYWPYPTYSDLLFY